MIIPADFSVPLAICVGAVVSTAYLGVLRPIWPMNIDLDQRCAVSITSEFTKTKGNTL